MSSNKTTNYQLHSWEPGDDFLRAEFNENFEKLDEAARIIMGSYTGNNTDYRAFQMGFRPQAVVLFCSSGWSYYNRSYYGGVSMTGQASPLIALTDTGFTVRHDGSTYMGNSSSYTYQYFAFR